MSSRILDPDTLIEPLRWKAQPRPHAGHPHDGPSGADPPQESAPLGHCKEPAPPAVPEDTLAHYHHPADEARIRQLESEVHQLEKRLNIETRTAREQGHQAGVTEGTEAGMQQEAANWTAALARLAAAIDEMSKMKTRFRAEVEEDAVKLALAIARKILNRELASDPEALVGLARVALEKLNLRELQRVRVHPLDSPAIEKMLAASSGPRRLEVIADRTLERGGAIFETERGMLDASVTTQLSEIERGLADMVGGAAK